MDVGDEVLIFGTFGDNSYNLWHTFKTYNLIYSHKYTKNTLNAKRASEK